MSLGGSVALATERIVEPVEGMHRAISGRWFRAVGPVAKPIQIWHDSIAGLVYGSIRLGGAAMGAGLDAKGVGEVYVSDAVQAWVNGLWGDDLGRRRDDLAIAMGVRDREGEHVSTRTDLAVAFPGATGQLVVLVHGLVETERSWRASESAPGLFESLEAHPDLTPVPVRYNTGLPVAVNGARLASLIEEIHRGWPVPIHSIALVGHSMGGLVARSACLAAAAAEYHWVDDVRDVVTVGAPHSGAPLEKLVNVVAWGLGATSATRPLATFLNRRSLGIKDLRHGTIVEEDWGDADLGVVGRGVAGRDYVPEGINHHCVAGVITADPDHPLGVIMGDLMVSPASGTGRRRLDPASVRVLGGIHHFDLPRRPAVIDQIMDWLAPPASS